MTANLTLNFFLFRYSKSHKGTGPIMALGYRYTLLFQLDKIKGAKSHDKVHVIVVFLHAN